LCTGSGVLAITLKLEVPNSRVVGTDICEKALKIAKINATKLEANVDFILGDLYGDLDRQFDVIVANPPYIKASEMDTLEPNVRLFEPKLALDGGSDGLDYYKRIIKESSRYLKQAGALFLEIGDDQAAKVAEIGEEAGIFAPAMVVKDLASKNRGIFLKRLK
ncbi:MAG: peptide chain release factor N(5)-glutamine methyltransferase, partial [Firmicutes bacterium]|nr:peptide chain release factor N(5)-glutamine methyltransferase [Bacillota bacterium]